MANILIVGLGNLGKRHLESILKSSLELTVFCYDININALDGFEWEDVHKNKRLIMVDGLTKVNMQIDMCLFSMSAKGRREMLEEVVSLIEVRYIVFEKVLFQTVEDYQRAEELLEKKNIKAWVNCPRRYWPSYQKLRENNKINTEFAVVIDGVDWGMLCNSIHYLDLIEYLSGQQSLVLHNLKMKPVIVDSKRAGYKEAYGTIEGDCGKCRRFEITCYQNGHIDNRIMILGDQTRYIINEAQGKILIQSQGTTDFTEEVFPICYQSQLSQKFLEDILQKGECELTSFEDSKRLHLTFINPLIQFFKEHGWEEEACPIT